MLSRFMPLALPMLFLSATSFARPLYFNELTGKVPNGNFPASCNTCHGGGGAALNAFGKDFASIVLNGDSALSPDERWSNLLEKDSDGDGVSNLEEMQKGTNPGKP